MHECPFKHFERYVLGKKESSVFTIFGSACGVALEQNLLHGNKQSWITFLKTIIKFIKSQKLENENLKDGFYKKWCDKNKKEVSEESFLEYKRTQIESFSKSALNIYKDIIPYFSNELKEWDIVSFEIPLLEKIDEIDLNFKGYIDCVLKHKEEDRYKILDFKTCSWGWDLEEKTNTAKLYQVILYKKYWCEKNKIDTSKVECAYLLLKRTPSKKDPSAVEMFDVTSGDRKLKNAEIWVLQNLKKIFENLKVKSPETCSYCSCNKKKRRYY